MAGYKDDSFGRKDYGESVKEGSMKSSEKESSGPKFTGYWKGTDKGRPGKKMVGGGP